MGAPLKVTRTEHTSQELRQMASKMKDAAQARRMQTIAFIMEGWTRRAAAAFACVDRQTVRDWVEQYNAYGVDGLATLSSPGRPRLLTPRQAEELYDIVVAGPDLDQDGVVRWRCEDLVEQVVIRFCVPEVHPSTMSTWLQRLGLTKLTARPFHPQKDEAAQEAFKRNFPAIVESALPFEVKEQGLPLEFWFQDEARVGQQGTTGRVWAPIGSRPAMVRDNRRENAYLFGAICPERRVGAAVVMPVANTEGMNAHLQQISLRVALGSHALLLCDGAGWHAGSKDLIVPSNITLVTLPSYAPELNPMENVWEFLRGNRLCARVWKTYENVVCACADAWNWFVSDAARIASIGARKWVIL